MTPLRFALACLVCATVVPVVTHMKAEGLEQGTAGETPWRGVLPLGAVSAK